MNTYPIELRQSPLAVVALVYLNHLHTTLESSIAEISNDSVKILSFEDEKSFRPKKVKVRDTNAQSYYEGYKPRGILKRDWMRKHQEEIPAVAVILVEWKVEDYSGWNTQAVNIIQKVENVRQQIQGRNTKLILIPITQVPLPQNANEILQQMEEKQEMDMSQFLSQNVPTQPQTDKVVTVDDFLNNLRKMCQLENSKHLICLQQSELSNGTIIYNKLYSRILTDLCHQYYKENALRVKKYKGETNGNLQPYLFVRHRFKVSYYFEIMNNIATTSQFKKKKKQQPTGNTNTLSASDLASNSLQRVVTTGSNASKAAKYLQQAYSYLQAVNVRDYSPSEIKAVGDVINFRLCVLKIAEFYPLNTPNTAINDPLQQNDLSKKLIPGVDNAIKQFLKHIAWYKSLRGDRKLLFKHYALVYKQYRTFW